MPEPKPEKKGPPPPKHDVPPHILKEIMDLKEKVGRLEGMVEVLMRMISPQK
jgi:tetrahydromethanopterin S-methyltransferase subunit B